MELKLWKSAEYNFCNNYGLSMRINEKLHLNQVIVMSASFFVVLYCHLNNLIFLFSLPQFIPFISVSVGLPPISMTVKQLGKSADFDFLWLKESKYIHQEQKAYK